MRLIDADALMDDINELKKSPWYNSDINGSRVVRSEVLDIVQMLCIDNAPTIDAVEVVRCKDCKYKQKCHKAVEHTTHEPTSVTIAYRPIDFCSYGDRKTEPQTDPCDGCVCDDGKHLMYCMNCKGIAWEKEPPKVEDEPQKERSE